MEEEETRKVKTIFQIPAERYLVATSFENNAPRIMEKFFENYFKFKTTL